MPTWSAFSVGRQTQIDRNDNNFTAERAGDLVGLTFGGPGDPLSDAIVEVTPDDRTGAAGVLDQRARGGTDRFTVDGPGGSRGYTFDAAASYEAVITYADGTTAIATLVVFQSTNGETFIAPGLTDAANAPLIAGPIQSITLTAVVTDTTLGLAVDRPDDPFVPCFVAGTRILTPDGPRRVEDLRPGDLVETLDHGPRPLVWVGGTRVAGQGALAPIRFAPGAIGNDAALLVSPAHRMLVSGWRAELLYGEPEVLVPAKALVNGDTIHRQPCDTVSYHHILFDRHEIVMAEGVLSESFHPGPQVLETDPEVAGEVLALFPELAAPGGAPEWQTARQVVRVRDARLLA